MRINCHALMPTEIPTFPPAKIIVPINLCILALLANEISGWDGQITLSLKALKHCTSSPVCDKSGLQFSWLQVTCVSN